MNTRLLRRCGLIKGIPGKVHAPGIRELVAMIAARRFVLHANDSRRDLERSQKPT
jgi:hypothetical protein